MAFAATGLSAHGLRLIHVVVSSLPNPRFSFQPLMAGGTRFCSGFAKKILLADPMGDIADAAFAAGAGSLTAFSAWIAMIALAFQIYFLFSAFADMAIGVARMAGFQLPEFFNSPYSGEGITDFWRRWLIPLSGNGGEKVSASRAIMLMLLIGALWHGPSWGLVMWGGIHGCLLAFERRMSHITFYAKWPKPLKISIMFFIVLITWAFFRAETFDGAASYLAIMFGLGPKLADTAPLLDADMLRNFNVVNLLVCMFVLWIMPNTQTILRKFARWKPLAGFGLFVLSVAMMLTRDPSPVLPAVRQHTQSLITRFGGEGNRAVHVGSRDWLYSRTGITALHGRGPLAHESATSEIPGRQSAKDVVIEFAAQLKERGVPLLLVPVPVKPMIYPEFLSSRKFIAPVYHPDQLALYEQLRAAGIDLIDFAPEMWRLKPNKQVFLQQDEHWTPDAMKIMAEFIAKHIRTKYPQALRPSDETPIIDARLLDRASHGGLVKLLDVASPDQLFGREQVTLVSISGLDPDSRSPMALIGDSFINVFDDPALGFASGDELANSQRMKAGFANQLAILLNEPLDVMAVNGGGSTATRQALARRSDDEVRAKKLVVWIFSCGDLLLSPPAARDAGVKWERVEFTPGESED